MLESTQKQAESGIATRDADALKADEKLKAESASLRRAIDKLEFKLKTVEAQVKDTEELSVKQGEFEGHTNREI